MFWRLAILWNPRWENKCKAAFNSFSHVLLCTKLVNTSQVCWQVDPNVEERQQLSQNWNPKIQTRSEPENTSKAVYWQRNQKPTRQAGIRLARLWNHGKTPANNYQSGREEYRILSGVSSQSEDRAAGESAGQVDDWMRSGTWRWEQVTKY